MPVDRRTPAPLDSPTHTHTHILICSSSAPHLLLICSSSAHNPPFLPSDPSWVPSPPHESRIHLPPTDYLNGAYFFYFYRKKKKKEEKRKRKGPIHLKIARGPMLNCRVTLPRGTGDEEMRMRTQCDTHSTGNPAKGDRRWGCVQCVWYAFNKQNSVARNPVRPIEPATPPFLPQHHVDW